jgi:putative oxidoreductase
MEVTMMRPALLNRIERRACAAAAALERVPLWLVQTMARVAIGGVFYKSGLLKMQSPEITLVLFRDEYRLPLLRYDVAAQLATIVEMTGAILLFLGLFTRLATLPLLGTIAIIQTLVYPSAWVEHLTWTTGLLLILLRGPGPLSLDHLLSRLLGLRPAKPAAA